MTQAVSYILIVLAILLFLHVFWIAFLWLKGKAKTKKEALVKSKPDYLIVYASQSGNAANLATQTSQQLIENGFATAVIDIQNLQVDDLKQADQTLWFVSTYGEGDVPDTARHFIQKIMKQKINLSHQQFAILALGDCHYANFCQFGETINQWLMSNHAHALFDMVRVDELNKNDLDHWQTQLAQVTQTSVHHFEDQQHQAWLKLKLVERELLNQGSQGNPLYRIRLSNVAQLSWKSGDIVEIQCANSDQMIQDFIAQYQDQDSEIDPSSYFEALKYKNLRECPHRSSHQSVNEWFDSFENLAIREYSVASIPDLGHLELVIRQEINQGKLGLGSGWLTQHSKLSEMIQLRIRSNPAFHLSDSSQPMILIGNGSGIAGLMSHLHQREKLGYSNNWLIFGERQMQFDRLYADQLQTWQETGLLTELDLIFSRDGHAQKYVKDCLIAKSEQLKAWVEQGAAIFVCGSLKTMAKDVDQTLNNILGEEQMLNLIQQKRYLRDVY